MVEFLKDINGKDFSYEKGKRYCSMEDFKDKDLKNKVFVRQPDSPKGQNWWTEFSILDNGVLFRILDELEISLKERLEEDRLLQL